MTIRFEVFYYEYDSLTETSEPRIIVVYAENEKHAYDIVSQKPYVDEIDTVTPVADYDDREFDDFNDDEKAFNVALWN